MDLVVPPGPGLPGGLVVPSAVLVERFSRASGPGGQGVNTTDSRVELELAVADLAVLLSPTPSRRLRSRLAAARDGVLAVDASEHRSQRRNRVAARERMASLIRQALAPPPPARRATRPTKGSQDRRLGAKRQRSITKAGRARPPLDG